MKTSYHGVKYFILLGLVVILIIYRPIISSWFLGEDYAWRESVKDKNIVTMLPIFISPPSLSLAGFYHPLVGLSYWFNYEYFDRQPWAFHLTNLVFHFGVFVLVVKLALQLIKDKWLAYLAGLLFLLFPFHSEAVAWIDGRHELMITFFYLLAFYLFIKNRRWLSKLAFILALTAKETAVTLPLTLITFLLINGKKKVVKKTKGYWLILAGYFLLHWLYVGKLNPLKAVTHLSFQLSRPATLFLIFLIIIGYSGWLLKRTKLISKPTVRLISFLSLLIGLTYLPYFFTYTQERYLYLASAAMTVFSAYLFGLFWYLKKKKISCFIIRFGLTLLIIGYLFWAFNYLNGRIKDWQKAGEIAKKTSGQFKILSQAIPESASIYLINLPDNFRGCYLFRTHVKEALETETGKKFAKLVVLPPALSADNTSVQVLAKDKMILTSLTGFLVFLATIQQQTDYQIKVISADKLEVSLTTDYLGKNKVYFFQYHDNRLESIF